MNLLVVVTLSVVKVSHQYGLDRLSEINMTPCIGTKSASTTLLTEEGHRKLNSSPEISVITPDMVNVQEATKHLIISRAE